MRRQDNCGSPRASVKRKFLVEGGIEESSSMMRTGRGSCSGVGDGGCYWSLKRGFSTSWEYDWKFSTPLLEEISAKITIICFDGEEMTFSSTCSRQIILLVNHRRQCAPALA